MARQKQIRKWEEHKTKRNGAAFFPMRYDVLQSPLFQNLSGNAQKLLLYLASQYTGYNNGDLTAVYGQMKQHGWKSSATLSRAMEELLESGLVILSRKGSRRLCNLYALSFLEIDPCTDGNGKSKLDIAHTQGKGAPDYWKPKHYRLNGN